MREIQKQHKDGDEERTSHSRAQKFKSEEKKGSCSLLSKSDI